LPEIIRMAPLLSLEIGVAPDYHRFQRCRRAVD
jgi:hypothetical protein